MTRREILVRGLLLPLEVYFQPARFAGRVAALAPDLPRDYSLWRAREKLRDAAFRHGLGELLFQAIVAFAWIPIVLGPILAYSDMADWPVPLAFGLASGVALCVAIGVAGGVAGGVAFGAAFGAAFGVAFGVLCVVADGVAADVAASIAFGAADGVAVGVVFSVAVSVDGGVLLALATFLGGVSAGRADRLTGGLAVGMAFGVAAALTVTHILNYLPEVFANVAILIIARLNPSLCRWLWRAAPVRWDETIRLPLPGLEELLATLVRADPGLAAVAVPEVMAHRYQRRASMGMLARLGKEDAFLVTSLPTLAGFGRTYAWLPAFDTGPDPRLGAMARMRDISREAGSAMESVSATNRLCRLEAALEMLKALSLEPGPFGKVLPKWRSVLMAAADEARTRQRQEEPIPQVYWGDGRPILPAGRADAELPFKGRITLFRRLENALGGKEGERATLLLIGQRRVGKTSVLSMLPRRLGSLVVPAFLDLQSGKFGGAENANGLLSGLAEEIVDEARRHRGICLPGIDRTAFARDPYPALERWLDKAEKALGPQVLLLCLDEFEALEDGINAGRFDTRILATLRHIVQHRPHVAVLLSGSHALDELPAHWVSALVTTTALPVSFLEEPDSRELIEQPVAGFPRIYTREAVDRIVGLTHCQPYLLQLVCTLLVERMNTARRMPPGSFVMAEDVQAVVPQALERGVAFFSELWRNQVGSVVAQKIMLSMAQRVNNRLRRQTLRGIERDEIALQGAIATLLRREIIERVEDGYRIIVPLVAEYVRRQMTI